MLSISTLWTKSSVRRFLLVLGSANVLSLPQSSLSPVSSRKSSSAAERFSGPRRQLSEAVLLRNARLCSARQLTLDWWPIPLLEGTAAGGRRAGRQSTGPRLRPQGVSVRFDPHFHTFKQFIRLPSNNMWSPC